MKRLIFLDYLRVIAFLSVLIGHKFDSDIDAAIINTDLISLQCVLLIFRLFTANGGFGVIIFFLVSGFIIPSSVNGPIKNFAIKRFFRIYPLYIFAVIAQTASNQIAGIGHVSFSSNNIDYKTLLIQLSLFGDFTSTPYTLGGVEWTLRAEILFYILTGLLGYAGFLKQQIKYLYPLLFIFIGLIFFISPLPIGTGNALLFHSYLTTYFPFLLLGMGFWLFDKKLISIVKLGLLIDIVIMQYYYMLIIYQPSWLTKPFALLGIFIFSIAYYYRNRFPCTRIIIIFSALTYPVYLFHNWAFEYIMPITKHVSGTELTQKFITSALLILICYFLNKLVEEPAIRVGKFFVRKNNTQLNII